MSLRTTNSQVVRFSKRSHDITARPTPLGSAVLEVVRLIEHDAPRPVLGDDRMPAREDVVIHDRHVRRERLPGRPAARQYSKVLLFEEDRTSSRCIRVTA